MFYKIQENMPFSFMFFFIYHQALIITTINTENKKTCFPDLVIPLYLIKIYIAKYRLKN